MDWSTWVFATTVSASRLTSSSGSSAAMSATRRPAPRSSAPASASPSPVRSSRCMAARSGSTASQAQAPTSTSRSPSRPGTEARLNPFQELRHQRLKVVHPVLSQRAETPALVRARAQAALHLFAHRNVFLLDLVRERDRLLHRLPPCSRARLGEEPFKYGQGPVRAHRQDDV